MNIQDCVAIITGGASGLGEATARHLLSLGAKGVSLFDLNQERGEALQRELGSRCLYQPVDISSLSDVDAAVVRAQAYFGSINAVVAAAAIPGPGKLISRKGPMDMNRFDKVMKVNLYGTLYVIRAAVQAMLENTPDNADGERGVIINVASGAAYEGQIGQIAYSASKAALCGMTMPLARELGSSGIRVVTVAPGAFETPIYDAMLPEVKAGLIDVILFPKRLGKPH